MTRKGPPQQPAELPGIPCPECRTAGRGGQGGARIGNRRVVCRTCNNFAQNVLRIATKRLREEYPEEYLRIRISVERDLYPQVIADFSARHNLGPASTSAGGGAA